MINSSYILPILVLVGVILFSSIGGPMFSSVERFQDSVQTENNNTSPYICVECNKENGQCTCFEFDEKKGSITNTDGIQMSFVTDEKTHNGSSLQPGKHPIPYADLVDRVKETEKTEKIQTKHIEDLRKVLANTITTLRDDDVLPSGTHCSCASAPVVDPLTGEVDLTEGCRPPGWLRMMNTRNERDEECRD
jgi:hypothetical protein